MTAKNNGKLFLAFDTSNYTTSVAVCTADGKVVSNKKKLLPVAEGERGLRQSDALFHHTNQLPELINDPELKALISKAGVAAVGCSSRPRDVDGSYMPCFLAGISAACSAALSAGTELFKFSHQCGHVMAALYSAKATELAENEFYAFHVSGGTTEVLHASPDKASFKLERIGGTRDICAGQLIDRVGVKMGLRFPAGAEMEALAAKNTAALGSKSAKICVTGGDCNLSGIENMAVNIYGETGDMSLTAAFVIDAVTRTLEKITENTLSDGKKLPVIYAGGVMSCSLIKARLSSYGRFAAPEFSSDNAAGCALLTRRAYLRAHGENDE